MNIKNMLQQIHSFMVETNIYILIMVPILIGIVILGLMFIIWPNGFDGTHAQGLWMSLGLFCIALAGIPKIIRRESFYGIYHLKGTLAVIDGILNIVLFIALASIPFIGWNR